MSTKEYGDLCHTIYKLIYDKLERKTDERLRFATRGTAQSILDGDLLRRFLRSLVPDGISTDKELGITEDNFVYRMKERDLYDFLAVLIFAGCRMEAAQAFVTKLVAIPSWSPRLKELSRLPVRQEFLNGLFGDIVATDKFFSTQSCFCAVVLRKGEEARISDLSTQRLPYVEEELLNKGSFGKVYRVVVSKGHFFDPDSVVTGYQYNDRDLEMARKDYEIDNKNFPRAGQEEREIMNKILGGSLHSAHRENIVYNWGSVEILPDTYSLFMQLATCDLRAYMVDISPVKPPTSAAKADIISCAEGLASGLNFLHSEMKTPDYDDMVCYHMDLKPDNVLVFKERGRTIWKLSDFGMARVKIRHHGQAGYERERDFNSWFKRRNIKQGADPSLSATINRRSEGTYLAPESVSVKPSMTTKSDVWSLGCVLSVVFVYLEEGGLGVEKYADARLDHRNSGDYDRFFVRGKFAPSQLHPEVKNWHSQLVQSAAGRSGAEGRVVKDILTRIEKRALEVDQDRRCDANAVRLMLTEARKGYHGLTNSTGAVAADPDRLSQEETTHSGISRGLLSKLHLRRNSKSETHAKIDTWYLSGIDDFKGCEISSDGTLVAYWTDKKIVLYTSQATSTGQGPEISSASPHYQLPESESSIWKSVGLTTRHLVASATGSSFYCYVFDLRDGNTDDTVLGEPVRIRIRQLPEIQKLAICPKSRLLACILRHQEDSSGTGSLLYVNVQRLIDEGKNTGGRTDRPFWSSPLELDWPGQDVAYLSVSDKKDIHIVFRPELASNIREHTIPVMHVSVTHSTIDIIDMESKGVDNSNAVGFFTTFTPLNVAGGNDGTANQPAAPEAVLVTREKRLHVQTFSASNRARDIQSEIHHYRILKLLDGQNGNSLIALGTSTANQKMLLLKVTFTRPGDSGKSSITITEVTVIPGLFYGDEYTARLASQTEEDSERFVLVAALVTANRRRAIYKVHLPDDTWE